MAQGCMETGHGSWCGGNIPEPGAWGTRAFGQDAFGRAGQRLAQGPWF